MQVLLHASTNVIFSDLFYCGFVDGLFFIIHLRLHVVRKLNDVSSM